MAPSRRPRVERAEWWSGLFVACGATLFAGGAALAYVVIREGLTVLLGFGGDATIAALSPDSYFSFLIAMLIIFGASFELPLLLILQLGGALPLDGPLVMDPGDEASTLPDHSSVGGVATLDPKPIGGAAPISAPARVHRSARQPQD
jgi:hypothetical protein